MKKVFLIALIASSAVGTGALTTKAAYAENLNATTKNNNIDALKKASIKDNTKKSEIQNNNETNNQTSKSSNKKDVSKKINEVNENTNSAVKIEMNNEQKFMVNLYKGFYNENPSKDNVDNWANLLKDKDISVAQILVDFVHSPKFEGLNYNNTQFIKAVANALNITNKLNEEKYINELNTGISKNEVLVQIFNDNIFKEILKSQGITSIGTMEIGPNNMILVTKNNTSNNKEVLSQNKTQNNLVQNKEQKNKENIVQSKEQKNEKDSVINTDNIKEKVNEKVDAKITTKENKKVEEKVNTATPEVSIKDDNIQKDVTREKNIKSNAVKEESSSKKTITKKEKEPEKIISQKDKSKEKEVTSKVENKKIQNAKKDDKTITSFAVTENANLNKGQILVLRMYAGFYNRKPLEGNLNFWANLMNSGQATVAQVVNDIVNSPEFRGLNYNNSQYVEVLYKGILGYVGDTSSYVYELNNGVSREQVLEQILYSRDCQAMLNEMGFKNIGALNGNKKSNLTVARAFVKNVYRGILRRPADEGGLDFWSNQVYENNLSVGTLLSAFLNSKEFIKDNWSNQIIVEGIYTAIYGQIPNNNQVEYYVNELNNGAELSTVVNDIINTSQAKMYLSSFGITNIGNMGMTKEGKREQIKAFLENLYESCFNRRADKGGLEFWSGQLLNGDSAINVINAFINSPEFKGQKDTSTKVLNSIYQSVLGKEISNNKTIYYKSLIANGVNPSYVLNDVIQEKEAQNYIKSFGIDNIGALNLSLQHNINGTRAFVNNIYEGILRRPADKGGLEFWTGVLYSNSQSVGSVLEAFINSPEFIKDNWNNQTYVEGAYKAIYGGIPNDNKVSYYVNLLNQGASKEFVLNEILGTPSAKEAINLYGVTNVGKVNVSVKNNLVGVKAVLTRVYEGILNRQPDKPGMAFWSHQVYIGNISVGSVLQDFMNSQEFRNDKFNPTEFINNVYRGLLNRAPSSQELNQWLGDIQNGQSYAIVVKYIFDSSEFQNYLNAVGITNRGTINITQDKLRGSADKIVTMFYEGLYNRKPDQGGFKFWTGQITNRILTVADVFQDFLNSQEFKSENLTQKQYISAVMKALTGNTPNAEVSNEYLQQLLNGQAEQQVLYNMFNSAQAQGMFKEAGFNASELGNIGVNNEQKIGTQVARGKILMNIHLRQGPSIYTSIITTIPQGANVVVVGRGQGPYYSFYKVQYLLNGKIVTGYVATSVGGQDVVEIYSDNTQKDFLGVLSAQYESNGDPGTISNDPGDYGGASYGAWQFSSNMGSLAQFVNWLQSHNVNFYNALTNAQNEDGGSYGVNFNNTWTSLANNYYNEFYNLQHEFVMDEFYNPLVSNLQSEGNLTNRLKSFAVQNVLWSTAVQNGVYGATQLISKFIGVNNIPQFITDIYHQRGLTNSSGELVYFQNCSPAIQRAVANRFKNELKQALYMYQLEVESGLQ